MKAGLRLVACVAIAGVLPGTGCTSGGSRGAGEQNAAAATTQPPRIVKDVELKFPQKLLGTGFTKGEVDVILDVGPDGKLRDHLFVAFTHHEFANEVSRVIPRWRFKPATIAGRPVPSTITLQINFHVDGMHVTERRPLNDEPHPGEFMFRARELHELDAVPRVLTRVSPVNPASILEPMLVGRVLVQFYIDEQGRVRMPTIVTADDERLGWAALGAIAAWQFEVPRRGGYPVLTRATQVFVFGPESEADEQSL